MSAHLTSQHHASTRGYSGGYTQMRTTRYIVLAAQSKSSSFTYIPRLVCHRQVFFLPSNFKLVVRTLGHIHTGSEYRRAHASFLEREKIYHSQRHVSLIRISYRWKANSGGNDKDSGRTSTAENVNVKDLIELGE